MIARVLQFLIDTLTRLKQALERPPVGEGAEQSRQAQDCPREPQETPRATLTSGPTQSNDVQRSPVDAPETVPGAISRLALLVYVGTRDEAQRNLATGLKEGVWGFKHGSQPCGELPGPGDLILLAVGVPDGPRLTDEQWLARSLYRLEVGTLTSTVQYETQPVWPDEHAMTPENRYVYRVRFQQLGSKRGVPLGKDGPFPQHISLLIKMSGCTRGSGKVVDAREVQAVLADLAR